MSGSKIESSWRLIKNYFNDSESFATIVFLSTALISLMTFLNTRIESSLSPLAKVESEFKEHRSNLQDFALQLVEDSEHLMRLRKNPSHIPDAYWVKALKFTAEEFTFYLKFSRIFGSVAQDQPAKSGDAIENAISVIKLELQDGAHLEESMRAKFVEFINQFGEEKNNLEALIRNEKGFLILEEQAKWPNPAAKIRMMNQSRSRIVELEEDLRNVKFHFAELHKNKQLFMVGFLAYKRNDELIARLALENSKTESRGVLFKIGISVLTALVSVSSLAKMSIERKQRKAKLIEEELRKSQVQSFGTVYEISSNVMHK